MRVIATLTLAFVCAAPAAARAQVAAGAPASPSSHLGAEARFDWVGVEGVGGPAFGVAALGAWAPHPHLEVGGSLDLRGAHLSADGQRGAGRIGLGPLRAWVGTGAATDRLAGGARLVGALGPGALGLDALDGGAPELGLSLRLDGSWAPRRWLEVDLRLEAGWIAEGVDGPRGAASLDVVFLDARTRPVVGVAALASRGVRPAVRPRAGVFVDLAPWSLAAELVVGLPGDPAGHLIGLTVTVLRRLEPLPATLARAD